MGSEGCGEGLCGDGCAVLFELVCQFDEEGVAAGEVVLV